MVSVGAVGVSVGWGGTELILISWRFSKWLMKSIILSTSAAVATSA